MANMRCGSNKKAARVGMMWDRNGCNGRSTWIDGNDLTWDVTVNDAKICLVCVHIPK